MKRKVLLFYLPNLIFNAKTFPGNPRKRFKAQKILRKFQKFQENSQIQIGTRTIQIKYLELMKKILESSNKYK
jgi:lipid A disaccharide synthetase